MRIFRKMLFLGIGYIIKKKTELPNSVIINPGNLQEFHLKSISKIERRDISLWRKCTEHLQNKASKCFLYFQCAYVRNKIEANC